MLKKKPTAAFDDLMSYVERINRSNGGSSSALFIIQNDRVVAEFYSGKHSPEVSARLTAADSQFNVASVRKSYIGFATAWALHSGAICSLDDPVLRYVSVSQEENASLNGITIRNLLTHTHGLAKDENGRLVRHFEPGTDWDYNNVGIGLLTDLVPHVTGSSIADLLNEKVFRPLGWKETGWRTTSSDLLVPVADDQGTSLLLDSSGDGSGGNLFVSARELAYWGYLHLKLGKIKGESLIPEIVIRHAISVQTPGELPTTLPRNGCLWLVKKGESSKCLIGNNVPENSFEIVGLYGPLVLVVPELDLVVVRMANRVGNYGDEQGSYIDYLKEFSNLAVAAAREKANR
jgi:CubicO group peptidase (beta-lactamase class C family)